MGIHSGPVSEVTDVSGRTNIAGAGINMAQRVMDCGDAGHILMSQHVADDLVQYRQWAPRLRDLGECEVKHGVRLHVLNLYTEHLGNPELPEKFRQAKETQTASAMPASEKPARGFRRLMAALIILAVVATGAGFYFVSRRPPANVAPIFHLRRAQFELDWQYSHPTKEICVNQRNLRKEKPFLISRHGESLTWFPNSRCPDFVPE